MVRTFLAFIQKRWESHSVTPKCIVTTEWPNITVSNLILKLVIHQIRGSCSDVCSVWQHPSRHRASSFCKETWAWNPGTGSPFVPQPGLMVGTAVGQVGTFALGFVEPPELLLGPLPSLSLSACHPIPQVCQLHYTACCLLQTAEGVLNPTIYHCRY